MIISECLCRVTITDIKGGGHVQAHYSPITVLIYEPKTQYEVKLKDFMTWLRRHGKSPREVMEKRKIAEILGISKS
jgi:hypothetical protein